MVSYRPKAGQLYGTIKEELFRSFVKPLIKTGGKIPTNRELAVRYRVNIATVGKALHELQNEGYIEKRVGAGTFVMPHSARPSPAVGVYMMGNIVDMRRHEAFKGHVSMAVQEALAAANRECRLYVDARIPAFNGVVLPQLEEDVAARKLSALIVVGASWERDHWLRRLGIPLVTYDHDFGWGSVRVDMEQAGYDAAHMLAEKGCRKIKLLNANIHEHICSTAAATWGRPLRAGMANALRNFGLPAPEPWAAEDLPPLLREPGRTFPEEAGYALFKHIWQRHHPDGIVVYTDVFGIGVARAIKDLKLKVGKDLHVVVLANKGLRWRELELFERLELAPADIAKALRELVEDVEADKPPREVVVGYQATPKPLRGNTPRA